MGCLLALVAAISPRVALVLVWIFTNLVDRAFEGFLLPLLGLLLLPFTTLIYVLAYQPLVGITGWGWFFVFLGLVFDLASYGGGALGRGR
jgi:CDP-diglyceride synthetase